MIGVIGGSGLYAMEGLSEREEITVETPYGAPSDAYIVGTLSGQRVAFLPRHGRGHRLNPSEVPSRANIYGFKQLGVQYLISVSAVGSLREDYAPGHVVVPDQLFDRTKGIRPATFLKMAWLRMWPSTSRSARCSAPASPKLRRSLGQRPM